MKYLELVDASTGAEYRGGSYVASKGEILFTAGNNEVRITAKIGDIRHNSVTDNISIVSEPLTREELYEISDLLSHDSIGIGWYVEAYGFLDNYEVLRRYGIEPGALVRIEISSTEEEMHSISRQDFVKNVLEKADMLKRLFLEVTVECVDKSVLDRICDEEIREALRLLLKKQEILLNALRKLYNAKTYSDYASVIHDVRMAIEGLVCDKDAGRKVCDALAKAYRLLGIAEEVECGALNQLSKELSAVFLGSERGLTNSIYSFACKLGSHTETRGKEKKQYIPRPYRHDAEYAVLQAMLFLNYLIKVLTRASRYECT